MLHDLKLTFEDFLKMIRRFFSGGNHLAGILDNLAGAGDTASESYQQDIELEYLAKIHQKKLDLAKLRGEAEETIIDVEPESTEKAEDIATEAKS